MGYDAIFCDILDFSRSKKFEARRSWSYFKCLFQAAGISELLDSRVIHKIDEMVADVFNSNEIARGIKQYVGKEIFRNQSPPHSSSRRFYLSSKDLRNHYDLARNKRKFAKADQDNIKQIINHWNKTAKEGDDFYFRPYTSGKDSFSGKQAVLFVHQLSWQKHLLLRYGQDMCFLDATYKTCKYALPLFFVCVKTNVGYQVVATFVTQNEQQVDIEEALHIIEQWNPNWKPSFCMTDKRHAEINAIESTFKGEFVYTLFWCKKYVIKLLTRY